MFNADDPQTVASLARLCHLISKQEKPLLFWIGAGASRWASYPSWEDLAKNIRRTFAKEVHAFDNVGATSALSSGDYPKVFEYCKSADEERYRLFLSDSLSGQTPSHIYATFTEKLKKINPLYIVTTNSDLCLEQNLPNSTVVERSDLERCVSYIQSGTSFIGKLHGSISSSHSQIFATSEYEELCLDKGYLSALEHLFEFCTVIFLGYGLKDSYVLELIERNVADHQIFGNGPHFLISSTGVASKKGFNQIQYSDNRFSDHRTAMRILDFVQQSKPASVIIEGLANAVPSKPKRSAFYISNFMPPGTHQTSQTAQVQSSSVTAKVCVGLGFINGELPTVPSRALHDLLVGLICFDITYLPLDALAALFNFFGDLIWPLIESEAIGFIQPLQDPAVMTVSGSYLGSIGMMAVRSADGSGPISIQDRVRRMLGPETGKQAQFEYVVNLITTHTQAVELKDNDAVPHMVRGALLMPRVARIIGFGEAVLPSEVPEWLTFPVLRLAHIADTAMLCDALNIQAVRIPFGGTDLISATFGVQTNSQTADSYASYVASGKFGSNLGAWVERERSLISQFARFRESKEGISLRAEIAGSLTADLGSEFCASIDAALSRNIPDSVLEKARDRMNAVALANGSIACTPVVWADGSIGDDITVLWRRRAAANLLKLASAAGVDKNSACLCGSQEKLRLCCLRPLVD